MLECLEFCHVVRLRGDLFFPLPDTFLVSLIFPSHPLVYASGMHLQLSKHCKDVLLDALSWLVIAAILYGVAFYVLEW